MEIKNCSNITDVERFKARINQITNESQAKWENGCSSNVGSFMYS